jgi:pimeloyl-ACP methyl ester carboxylesterase
VKQIRRFNGDRKIHLVAHSWGTLVAARYASEHPGHVATLVLFGPPVVRNELANPDTAQNAPFKTEVAMPSHHPLTAWAQYRRFVEDVPRGEPQVFSEAHFDAWSRTWLGTDVTARTRIPESVMTPYGPIADITALWSGESLVVGSKIKMPVLLVRGEWDSVCDDTDALRLLTSLGTTDKKDIKIPRGTHLMHLESQRGALYVAVNTFIQRVARENR